MRWWCSVDRRKHHIAALGRRTPCDCGLSRASMARAIVLWDISYRYVDTNKIGLSDRGNSYIVGERP